MHEITDENAIEYLRSTGRIPAGGAATARVLGWGVSNVVLRVEVEGSPPFVLKQAREKLRTKKLWVSRLERIWTERDALVLLDQVLPDGVVPRVLFSDDPNYLFAMTHAPADSVVWKEQLLAGRWDSALAFELGETLGKVHSNTIDHPALPGRLTDTTVFDELRIDPFYRELARVHPELEDLVCRVISSMAAYTPKCLVLGDFSPKNILVHSQGFTLVDFETAHAGDPAFDLGFFLSHLWLKSMRTGIDLEAAYESVLSVFDVGYFSVRAPRGVLPSADPRVFPHFWLCVLARVDGKSPVDYLDDQARDRVRTIALDRLRECSGGTGNAVMTNRT